MQTTGCLQRYSPSIPSAAQTEDGCLSSLHLPDLFYSSRFKLTYCSCLLREGARRGESQRTVYKHHARKPITKAHSRSALWKISPADRRQVSPQKMAWIHGFSGLKSSTNSTTAITLACSRRCRSMQKMYSQGQMQKPWCPPVSQEPGHTSLGPACPGRRGHRAPSPKALRSHEQVSLEPGLNHGEGIKATQPTLGKRQPQRAAQWGLGQGGQIQLSTSCK